MYPNLDYIQLKNRIIEVLNNYPSLEYQVNISDVLEKRYNKTQQAKKTIRIL